LSAAEKKRALRLATQRPWLLASSQFFFETPQEVPHQASASLMQ
jgi:hypothetical protein